MIDLKHKLDKKEILTGLWNIVKTSGSIPDSREGTTVGMVDNKIYVFGGFSRDIYKDIKILDLNT